MNLRRDPDERDLNPTESPERQTAKEDSEELVVKRWRRRLVYVLAALALVLAFGGGTLMKWKSVTDEYARREATLVAKKDAEISEREAVISEKEAVIAENAAKIEEQKEKIRWLEYKLMPMTKQGVAAARLQEFYGIHSYDRNPAFWTDEEFKEWCQENCPEAVYPSAKWAPKGVILSWAERPGIWGRWLNTDYLYELYFCWTSDYRHCFMLDLEEGTAIVDPETKEHLELTSGWLVVDGVRAALIDEETYDISDPYELIRQYQVGEWDGGLRRSHDGSTTVEIDSYSGGLYYTYRAWFYDEQFDPEGLAWKKFASKPWWFEEDASEEILALSQWELKEEDWTEKNKCISSSLSLGLYGDLPVDFEVSESAILEQVDGLMRYVDETGVKVFQRGEQLYAWDFADFDCGFEFGSGQIMLLGGLRVPTREYANDMLYLYDGNDQLIALRRDGSAEVVLDRVFRTSTSGRSEFWGFQGDTLIYWHMYKATANEPPLVVAEDVLTVDCSKVFMLTKTDGSYVVMRDRADGLRSGQGSASDPSSGSGSGSSQGSGSGFKVEYLGEYPVAFYEHLFEVMDAGLTP